MTVYSLRSSVVYILVGLKNAQMACEELLQHTQPARINVCLSPAPSQMCLFRFRQRTSQHRDAVCTSQSVCLHFFVSTSKKDLEGKERPSRRWSPVHLITGTTRTGPAVSESLGCSHISRTRAQTCAELRVTLVGAVYYLSGSVPSACLPALHKPNNASPLRLLPLWTAAQWKKGRRTWWEERGTCRKGHIRAACQSRCYQDLTPIFTGVITFLIRYILGSNY